MKMKHSRLGKDIKVADAVTFAIAGALESLERKLNKMLKQNEKLENYFGDFVADGGDDQDLLEELKDEYGLTEDEALPEPLSEEDIEAINFEIDDLSKFRELAISIQENAKGLALLEALSAGLKKAKSLGALDKAIIFTESRRTQSYLLELLGIHALAVVFNGKKDMITFLRR